MKTNKPYYVLLTGSQTNSGDHLIKYRANKLLSYLRPDREIINFNGWEAFDKERLSIVNSSVALILTGGPALRINTSPDVYPLVEDLEKIKVPIITFGVGYRDASGSWENTKDFEYSKTTKKLLNKINKSGYKSTVRCYNTMNTLLHNGFDNFVMAGCPALYDIEIVNTINVKYNEPVKIAFSTGRKYLNNPFIYNQQLDLIQRFNNKYNDFVVTFHDPISPLNEIQSKLIKDLEKKQIKYIDISGLHTNLIEFYSSIDLHIGYRVHGHIFMLSKKKVSVLLSEDSRGKGIKNTLGGLVFDAYQYRKFTYLDRIKRKIGLKPKTTLKAINKLYEDVNLNIENELRFGMYRTKVLNDTIKSYYDVCKDFISNLP